jgi:hypothetical protein
MSHKLDVSSVRTLLIETDQVEPMRRSAPCKLGRVGVKGVSVEALKDAVVVRGKFPQ